VMAFVLSYNTNKLVRTEDERAKSLISETQKMIEKMDIAHREMLAKMDERTEKMDDTLRKIDDTLRKMDDTLRKMDDTLRFLGTLIKAEGEEAKELINKVLEKMPG
ncbi:MAG: hypothetical protein ACP5OB_04100, partial [Candidatus Ratteibacteria bacterium]